MNSTTYTTPTQFPTDLHKFGDNAKILAMFALGVGSFVFGMLPALISGRTSRRFPLFTSILLCFGAGILLATALVHMLPDVRKQMPENAEIALCGGFFIVYFIDEFVHFFFGEAIQHSHESASEHNHHTNHNHNHQHNNYGTNTETAPLLHSNSNNHIIRDHEHNNHNHGTAPCDTDAANARLCHTSHTEPCVQTMTGTLGLLIALSLHSFVEGLAIGVQGSQSKVLFLLGAVASHKFVMAFCLGFELRSNPISTLKSQLIAIAVFSFGSVFGIGVGMFFVDLPTTWTRSALPILQALAGGTLLYVTVCEVMPREKARWHQKPGSRAAGLVQFFAIALGFTVMTLINYFLDDD